MKLYHLSHTDLDGYACQLISKKIYKNRESKKRNRKQRI